MHPFSLLTSAPVSLPTLLLPLVWPPYTPCPPAMVAPLSSLLPPSMGRVLWHRSGRAGKGPVKDPLSQEEQLCMLRNRSWQHSDKCRARATGEPTSLRSEAPRSRAASATPWLSAHAHTFLHWPQLILCKVGWWWGAVFGTDDWMTAPRLGLERPVAEPRPPPPTPPPPLVQREGEGLFLGVLRVGSTNYIAQPGPAGPRQLLPSSTPKIVGVLTPTSTAGWRGRFPARRPPPPPSAAGSGRGRDGRSLPSSGHRGHSPAGGGGGARACALLIRACGSPQGGQVNPFQPPPSRTTWRTEAQESLAGCL